MLREVLHPSGWLTRCGLQMLPLNCILCRSFLCGLPYCLFVADSAAADATAVDGADTAAAADVQGAEHTSTAQVEFMLPGTVVFFSFSSLLAALSAFVGTTLLWVLYIKLTKCR